MTVNTNTDDAPLLNILNLSVKFPTRFGEFTALDDVSLDVNAGEIHGLVGESGAGKSTVGAAIIGLLQSPGYIANGNIQLSGEDLRALDKNAYHQLRGSRISMIFQDPQTSLNPLLTVSEQLVETIRQHSDIDYSVARTRAIALLKETGLQDVEQRFHDYPHQFSGGMRQRVVIALALCTDPELIIADEPTTALDVSVQKQILQLIRELCNKRNVGIILITHDIGVISEITDRVTVLRSGRVVESGATKDVLGNPQEEYTQALMAAVPRLDTKLHRFRNIVAADKVVDGDLEWRVEGAGAELAEEWLLGSAPFGSAQGADNADSASKSKTPSVSPLLKGSALQLNPASSGGSPTLYRPFCKNGASGEQGGFNSPILKVSDLAVTFHSERPGWFSHDKGFQALQDINFNMPRGEVLGVVGESGSGKSTLAKAIVGLVDPSAGTMSFNDELLPPGSKRPRQHPARRQIQMVFQDPYSSLNNRQTVEHIIAEPIRFYGLATKGSEVRQLVASVLELVEMPQRAMLKYPHQFSGGQRQRIAVARALVARPEFLICDEPTSALDVSIQAQILNLLKDLQEAFGLSILFISHNLAVVRQMVDRVIVLRHGELIETAETEAFFAEPEHEYSRQLLRETPDLGLLG